MIQEDRQVVADRNEKSQAGQIEITPEMIEVGVLALSPNEVLPTESEVEVVSRVYRAMARAQMIGGSE